MIELAQASASDYTISPGLLSVLTVAIAAVYGGMGAAIVRLYSDRKTDRAACNLETTEIRAALEKETRERRLEAEVLLREQGTLALQTREIQLETISTNRETAQALRGVQEALARIGNEGNYGADTGEGRPGA